MIHKDKVNTAAMIIWAAVRNITSNVESRWNTIEDDCVTDIYRDAARKVLKLK